MGHQFAFRRGILPNYPVHRRGHRLVLHQFGEDAVAGCGVDEGDAPAVEAGAERFVDKAALAGTDNDGVVVSQGG